MLKEKESSYVSEGLYRPKISLLIYAAPQKILPSTKVLKIFPLYFGDLEDMLEHIMECWNLQGALLMRLEA